MVSISLPFLLLTLGFQAQANPYQIIYQWNEIDVLYPSSAEKRNAIKNGSFISKNLALGGLKIWRNYMYLSIPRFRPGVPIAMSRVPYDPKETLITKNLALEPWPSWKFQEIGNCQTGFQFVQSMEIDQYGRMWIIDSGRVNLLEPDPISYCKPMLFVVDLLTSNFIREYQFPEAVVSDTENFLDDLVVGCTNEENCFAYIVNTLQNQLTIYDYKKNESWSVVHPTMNVDPKAVNFTILGKIYTVPFGLDGIGLAPRDVGFNRIYYSPLASYNMYSVSKQTLLAAKSDGLKVLKDTDITDHGKGVSQADGLAIDSSGLLYYGRLSKNALAAWNTKLPRIYPNDLEYLQNNRDLGWVDTLAFDNRGHIVFTTDRLNLYVVNGYNASKVNFRIIRAPTIGTSKSYMYSEFA